VTQHFAAAGLSALLGGWIGVGVPQPALQPSIPRGREELVAQLTYQGYMTCQNARGSCEVELNRKKSEIKALCRAIWSGNWPERAELGPEAVAMYINWCDTAKSDIYYALNDYPNLLGFLTKYKEFDASTASDEDIIYAAKNSAIFTSRCKSGNAQRAASTVDLWGSNKYDAPGLNEMYSLVPTRSWEILAACGDPSSRRSKAWIDRFNEALVPAMVRVWDKRAIALTSHSHCTISPGLGKLSLTQKESELQKVEAYRYELALTTDLKEMLDKASNKSLAAAATISLSSTSQEISTQVNRCNMAINTINNSIDQMKMEAEKKALEKASKEQRMRLEREYQQQRAAAAAARRAAAARNYQPTPPAPRVQRNKPPAPKVPVWFDNH